MATFTKNSNNTNGAAAPEKGTPRVTRVNLVNSDKAPGLVAFANAIFEGKVFMSDIWVRENASGDAFISFPAQKRMKNGTEVLDEAGKPIYDDFYGPASKEAREQIQNAIFEAVQAAMDGTPQKIEKGQEGIRVTLLPEGSKAIAVVSVVMTTKIFMNSISVREGKNGDAYLSTPSRKRMKGGQEVLDDNGRPIYDAYYGPASKEAKDALEKMVFDAVQDKMNEA